MRSTTDRDGVVDSMQGEVHGGCVAGGTDPGTGALAALGFMLLVGVRAGRRVRRVPRIVDLICGAGRRR